GAAGTSGIPPSYRGLRTTYLRRVATRPAGRYGVAGSGDPASPSGVGGGRLRGAARAAAPMTTIAATPAMSAHVGTPPMEPPSTVLELVPTVTFTEETATTWFP